jgi:hypothetical protein
MQPSAGAVFIGCDMARMRAWGVQQQRGAQPILGARGISQAISRFEPVFMVAARTSRAGGSPPGAEPPSASHEPPRGNLLGKMYVLAHILGRLFCWCKTRSATIATALPRAVVSTTK